MKVLVVLAVCFIVVASAFPSADIKPDTESELHTKEQEEHKNDLLSVDVNAQSNSAESADRPKRYIYLPNIGYPYPSPFAYASNFLAPFVSVMAPGVSVQTAPAAATNRYTGVAATSTRTGAVAAPAAAPVSVRVATPFATPIVNVAAPGVSVVV